MQVLQTRRKGKVCKWPRTEETNHESVPAAQTYVRTSPTWIVEPCVYFLSIYFIIRFDWQSVFRANYSKMDQVKFFKGCLPQILFGPFLNTLSHLFWSSSFLIKTSISLMIIFQMIVFNLLNFAFPNILSLKIFDWSILSQKSLKDFQKYRESYRVDNFVCMES